MEKNHARSLLLSVPTFSELTSSKTLRRRENVETLILFPTLPKGEENIDFIKRFAESLTIESPDLLELVELSNIWSWKEIRFAYPKLKFMVSMGFSFKDLGLQCSNVRYQLIRLQNTYLVFTDAPDRVRSDKKLKLQLWNEVKSLSI